MSKSLEVVHLYTRMNYPSAVVFDLDYTLWPCWCDTHIYMPLKAVSKTEVSDLFGMTLSMYRDVESIVEELVANGVIIIGASRTATPRVAKELLSLLHLNGKPAIKYFDNLQWGQGSKIHHISRAAKELKIEEELKKGQFILFDDEIRNRDVSSINCHFAHISDETEGLTRSIFDAELATWRQNFEHIE